MNLVVSVRLQVELVVWLLASNKLTCSGMVYMSISTMCVQMAAIRDGISTLWFLHLDRSTTERCQKLTWCRQPSEWNIWNSYAVPKMPEVVTVDVSDLRFTQDSIAKKFKGNYEGTTLDLAVTMLETGQLSPATFEKLVVVYHDGLLWSVNNRRLWVFRQAKVSRITVILLTSAPNYGLQAVINSPRGLSRLTKNDKDNLQKLIDIPAVRSQLGTAHFLPHVRQGKGRRGKDGPSNNQQWIVQTRSTTSSSRLLIPNPVQPKHASANASAMTQLPQSRHPHDRGSISRLPDLKQEQVKRPTIPVGSGSEIRCPSTYSTSGAYKTYSYSRNDQASPDHHEVTSGAYKTYSYSRNDQASPDHHEVEPGIGDFVRQSLQTILQLLSSVVDTRLRWSNIRILIRQLH